MSTEVKEILIWTGSNSPYASVVRVQVPDTHTSFPCPGVWKKSEAGLETVIRLDPSQTADGWLAWAVDGKLVQAKPEDGIRVVAHYEGRHHDLTIMYVRPDTAVRFAAGYKRRHPFRVVVLASGETRPAHADDFVTPEVLLP